MVSGAAAHENRTPEAELLEITQSGLNDQQIHRFPEHEYRKQPDDEASDRRRCIPVVLRQKVTADHKVVWDREAAQVVEESAPRNREATRNLMTGEMDQDDCRERDDAHRVDAALAPPLGCGKGGA